MIKGNTLPSFTPDRRSRANKEVSLENLDRTVDIGDELEMSHHLRPL